MTDPPWRRNSQSHVQHVSARTDPSAEVRKSSATSLGILGAESMEVRAALENAKTDRDESVREAARKALAKISAK